MTRRKICRCRLFGWKPRRSWIFNVSITARTSVSVVVKKKTIRSLIVVRTFGIHITIKLSVKLKIFDWSNVNSQHPSKKSHIIQLSICILLWKTVRLSLHPSLYLPLSRLHITKHEVKKEKHYFFSFSPGVCCWSCSTLDHNIPQRMIMLKAIAIYTFTITSVFYGKLVKLNFLFFHTREPK